MKPGIRKVLRVGGWTVGSAVLLLFSFIALLAFPGFMFAHEVKVANLSVYTDADIESELEPVLREIRTRLASSAIDAPATHHEIFFGHDKPLFEALQGARSRLVWQALGRKPSLTYNASWPPAVSHVITFRVPDMDHGKLLSETLPPSQDMVFLLTHEVAHSLVFERLGIGRSAALPLWKAEGYPDYLASSSIRAAPGYSLRGSMDRLLREDLTWLKDSTGNLRPMGYDCAGSAHLTLETGDSWNTCYYLSRLLVEYQLDIKRLTFDELMSPKLSDVETWRELVTAYRSGQL
jgi:hypothetical protein